MKCPTCGSFPYTPPQAGEPPRAEETPREEDFRPWLSRQLETCRNRAVNDNTKKSREYHGNVRVLLQGILAEYDRRQATEITALRQRVDELQGEHDRLLEEYTSVLIQRDSFHAEVKTRDEQIAKGESVFEAVVYAYEGRAVAPDLESHSFVNRGRKHYAALKADAEALREALARLIQLIDHEATDCRRWPKEQCQMGYKQHAQQYQGWIDIARAALTRQEP